VIEKKSKTLYRLSRSEDTGTTFIKTDEISGLIAACRSDQSDGMPRLKYIEPASRQACFEDAFFQIFSRPIGAAIITLVFNWLDCIGMLCNAL